MALEALVFDVDGTLVDTEELHRRAFNQAFLEFELGWEWPADLYSELLNISGGAARIEHYIDSRPVSELQKLRWRRLLPAIHREKTRIYGDLIGGNMVRLRPGVARLIDEARQAGVKIGFAATSQSANVQPLIASAFGREAGAAFDAVVSADLVARKKPAPDLYLLVVSMLGVSPEHSVAFEDSCNGVAAAKSAGLAAIATPSRWTRGQDFSRADLVLGSLGAPDQPLTPAESARIGGAPMLGLAEVERVLGRLNEARGPAALHNQAEKCVNLK